jgi:23S rRNA (adenine2503-C2)-methyltransferase
MKILRRISVPTGDILVVQGKHGKLEMLSLGDYGKDVNLKCDALGLSRDIEKVEHTKMLPLEKKWVITISTQYGCSMTCNFCDVPMVGPGRNATFHDMGYQVETGLGLHPEVKGTERLNIHFARMGEPTFNPAVLEVARHFKRAEPEFRVHPVVSTMMPRSNKWLEPFLESWMHIKNDLYEGNAGLQMSINSTDAFERADMFGGSARELSDIGCIARDLPKPVGRKITLNFAVAGWTIDPAALLRWFDPEHFIIKLTPMHKTLTAEDNEVRTEGDYTTIYPYKHHEEALKKAGYDVLVFVASKEEDESRITCGNAILSGSKAAFAEEDHAVRSSCT